MRDPDLVVRAQLAASALEGAWHRWRVVHGLTADLMPAVSSYVGYSLEEPWGQPRVVFGLAAEDAEQLVGLLERHDCVGPIYTAVATMPGMADLPARTGVWTAPLPVPRQAPSECADQPLAGDSRADQPRPDQQTDYDEPVYRQAAAAMMEAAAARSSAWPDNADPVDTRPEQDDVVAGVTPEFLASMGSLAKAASAARAEAEARIRAALTELADEPTDDLGSPSLGVGPAGPSAGISVGVEAGADDAEDGDLGANAELDDGAEPDGAELDGAELDGAELDGAEFDDAGDSDAELGDAGDCDGDVGHGDYSVLPHVYATDVLEPLPRPEAASGAYAPGLDDEEEDHLQDDQDGSANGQQDASPTGLLKRGRVTRSYPIPRLSRTKRPGAPSQPTGT